MTRRRKEHGHRRKALRTIIDNVVRHPKHRFMFQNVETGEEVVITQHLTHRGRVSAQYQHHTRTRAGRTRSHPLQTKARRRAANKQARRSRKANRVG